MSDHKQHKGLSPSSLALYTGCQRKYFHSKIAKTPKDSDAQEEVESLQVGKAFHRVLELAKHELDGYSLEDISKVVLEHDLTREVHLPLIFAMLSSYKSMHKNAGLKAIAFEIPLETDVFFGIVDVVLQDQKGGWFLGDMKTAASFSQNLIPTLPRHPQLNLYAAYKDELAKSLDLDSEKYLGCRYRLTTKSKMARKDGEEFMPYVNRMLKTIKSFDFILAKDLMNPQIMKYIHERTFTEIQELQRFVENGKLDNPRFSQNYGNCMAYFRSCEFWSNCHGKNFSDMQDIKMVMSD